MSSIVLQMRALSPKYVGNFFQGWHLISERYISLFWKHAVWSFVKKLNRHQRKVNDENDVNVALVGVAINVDSNDTWTTPKLFSIRFAASVSPRFHNEWFTTCYIRESMLILTRGLNTLPLSLLSPFSPLSHFLSLPHCFFFKNLSVACLSNN